MITITYEKFMMALALFTALCVAGGWLIKIVKSVKKPADDVATKLDRDNKRIIKLEDSMDKMSNSMKLLMKSNLAVLSHIVDGNNTKDLAAIEKEIHEYLIHN